MANGVNIVDLLAEKSQVFPSKGEAKKMIAGGGVALNKEKITDPAQTLAADKLINGKFLVAQKGKKNYFLIEAV
jgi:tyrosyl-tRNA synthetase